MNALHIPSLRTAGRSAIAVIFLAFSLTGVFAAEGVRSSAASAVQIPGSPMAGNTSVTGELQKRFKASGRQMPSMRTTDLPYTTMPRMNRVRKCDKKSTVPAKKKGLLSKIFGRFRRDKSGGQVSAPEPPPIVLKAARGAERHNDSRSNGIRPVQPVPLLPSPTVVKNQARSLWPARKAFAGQAQSSRTVRPPLQSMKPAVVSPEDSLLHMIPQDGFVDAFEHAESFPGDESFVDLDSLGTVPEITFPAEETTPDGDGEPLSAEPESGPFSGVRINEVGDFVNPFEDSDADVNDNESLELNEVAEAVQLIPEKSGAGPAGFEPGYAEYDDESSSFAEPHFGSADIEQQPTTAPRNHWRARRTPDEVSPSGKSKAKSISRNRRLAPMERVPDERIQTERWQRSTTPRKATDEALDDD